MPNMEHITKTIQTSIEVKQSLLKEPELLENLKTLIQWSLDTLKNGGKVLFAGNGGSFSDAQHLSAELLGRLCFNRAPLPALALGTNSSCVTAIGNDFGYEEIFIREIKALGKADDVFIPLSTSGNSANIVLAIEAAKEQNLKVMGFTGQTGGKMAELVPCIKVPTTRIERIQECHILLGHILCEQIEALLFDQPERLK